jgi:site-specific DNA-methyltransferase (adenine-specific)|nr:MULTISPECIES: site-specific DNA-methyltransferase [unclassified Mesotoga]
MSKTRSSRNRTIDISISEGKHYLDRCIRLNEITHLDNVINKTILGDMFQVCKFLPRNSVDLLIVDPPYNLSKQYHGNSFSRKKDSEYLAYTISWIEAIIPLLKENSSIYVCCDWETSLIIGSALMRYFKVRNRITWQREKGRGAKKNWKNAMEDIWFATKSEDYFFNYQAVKVRRKVIAPYRVDGTPKDWKETSGGNFRDTHASNFWDDITIPFWSMPENTAHPTQKPEKLVAKLLLASSNLGNVILDPFLGSGTTSVVAKKLKRNYIGIEQNKRYCLWAEKRLEMADFDTSIQGYTNGVFWERNTLASQGSRTKRVDQSPTQPLNGQLSFDSPLEEKGV